METKENFLVNTTVFNPMLEGQAVKLSGMYEGIFIVSKVEMFNINVVDAKKELRIDKGQFESDKLKMSILREPQTYMPVYKPPRQLTNAGTGKTIPFRRFRMEQQISEENAAIERILQENIEPMRLEQLLKTMQMRGYTHWNNNNASGFVKHAIKGGMNIVKVAHGIYSYNWGGQ